MEVVLVLEATRRLELTLRVVDARDARAATGIESRILITAIRNLGPERAEAIAGQVSQAAATLNIELPEA